MYVTYLAQDHGSWAQYDRAAAGYYRGGRRARRRRELAAWHAGVRQIPRLLERVGGGAPCGAPGLLGGARTSAEIAARRAAAYGPGWLP